MKLERLKALKTKANLTNKQISEMTDISESTLSRIFTGEGQPKFEDIAMLARILGGSLDELAGIHRQESDEVANLRAKIASLEAEKEAQAIIIAANDRVVDRMERVIAYLKRMVTVLGGALGVVMTMVLVALVASHTTG